MPSFYLLFILVRSRFTSHEIVSEIFRLCFFSLGAEVMMKKEKT